ncbi:MAG: lytic transglycosylase domain-containing protein [Treponema sp.]|nr:lytic transglycosylase domain-containing protein [Treponema sp.]
MGIPKKEAAQRLKRGNINFILDGAPENMGELARIHPSAPFYAGLLVRSRQGEPQAGENPAGKAEAETLAAALFEAALDSPGPRIREAAAGELLLPLLEGKIPAQRILNRRTGKKLSASSAGDILLTLRGAALYALGNFEGLRELYGEGKARSSWDRALAALAGGEKEKIREFLFTGLPDRARQWAFQELSDRYPQILTEIETAAMSGRFAVARSAFGEGLSQFRPALKENPGLFFEYPDLITDLGRGFQFSPANNEGVELFSAWDRHLEGGGGLENMPGISGPGASPAGPALGQDKIRDIRYRLLFFSGRIARQREGYDEAAEFFARAIPFAPDPLQEDACIWYILSMTLQDKPGLLPLYLPLWHNDPYFADILDIFARNLTAKRQWKTLLETFALICSRTDRATIAKYAYIIGRAVEEGYILPGEAAPYLPSGSAGEDFPGRDFFRIAFEEGQASLYYRALSASFLEEKLLPLQDAAGSGGTPKKKLRPRDFPHAAEMELLLGFFEYGAASFAPAYIELFADQLTTEELRALAEAQTAAGYWEKAIRLVSLYMDREDYRVTRRDMELYYPRPFRELIEKNAREAGLSPAIFYGLIRTESAFIPDIVSRVGATGLSQLMPATAEDMAGRIARQGGPDYRENGKIELRNPRINLHIGAVYLNYLIEHLESPALALLAYNGGMGRVRRWRAGEPDLPVDLFLETIEYRETREYGRRVLAAAAAYGYLYYGMSMEGVVADIFKEEP